MVPFSFCDFDLMALSDDALFWPRHSALIVADLHFEKASWFAGAGQMLPPYDSRVTLDRIARLIEQTGAQALWCLGDNFHDEDGVDRLVWQDADHLRRLTRMLDWCWITGNHDPELRDNFGGRVVTEMVVDGLVFRHEADPSEQQPELSGHFHPKYRVHIRGQSISRRCFVVAARKMILPAFGALTGGLDAAHPEIMKAIGGQAEAYVPLKSKLLRFPIAA